MPHAAYIEVCDNSAEAAADGTVPDRVLVLEMENGQVITPAPDNLKALQRAPEWTKAILEARYAAEEVQTRGPPGLLVRSSMGENLANAIN
jgi:hypothetical protein